MTPLEKLAKQQEDLIKFLQVLFTFYSVCIVISLGWLVGVLHG